VLVDDNEPMEGSSPDERDDAICDRFEAAWRAGSGPRIEDYLEGIEGRERADLLGKLLRIELELCVEKDDRPVPEPYRARWPEYGTVIDSAFDAAAPPRPAVVQGIELRPGAEPIPGYRLVEKLGEGTAAQVWKAVGPGGLELALKFVRLDGPLGPAERRAIESVKHIRHVHLLALSGIWEVGMHLVIAMELAERTLLDVFREAVGRGADGIPAPEIFEYFQEAARGIDYLNEPRHPMGGKKPQGVQHRDIKPANLLLVGGCVKVGDYGLARVMEKTLATASGTGGMTPAYAAPERFNRQTSGQSDQYSLACTYCHMRGGLLPFTGNLFELKRGHSEWEPDLSMLPERERAVVARALAKDPKDRWPNCRAFVQALRAASAAESPATARGDASSARDDGVEPSPSLPSRRGGSHRRRLSLSALAAVAVFACVPLVAMTLLSLVAPTPPDADKPLSELKELVDRPFFQTPEVPHTIELQVPYTMTVDIGKTTTLRVVARRGEGVVGQPIMVLQDGQAEGVSIIPQATTIPADSDWADIMVQVAPGAAEGDREVRLIGTVGTGTTRAKARIMLWLESPLTRSSFKLQVPHTMTVDIGKTTTLRVVARRGEGVVGQPITVLQDGQAEGVSIIPQATTIPADSDWADIMVQVAPGAAEGDREVRLIGTVGTGTTRAKARIMLQVRRRFSLKTRPTRREA
jgi:serine/threonine protein kinase